jgi:hypothetical protein
MTNCMGLLKGLLTDSSDVHSGKATANDSAETGRTRKAERHVIASLLG